MPVLSVEKPLRESLGNDAAVDSLIRLINASDAEKKRDVIEFVEEKFERRLSEEVGGLEVRLSEKIDAGDKALSEKMSELEVRLSEKMSELEVRLSEKIVKGDSALLAKISQTKSEIIKWMFIFWVGQVGMILGILFAFFKR